MKRLLLSVVLVLTAASVANARGGRRAYYGSYYQYAPIYAPGANVAYYNGYYGGGPYGIPYHLRGQAFYSQQFLYGPGIYRGGFGPRGGVGVGFGVF